MTKQNNSKKFACPGCPKYFKTHRGMSLHQNHNPLTCGKYAYINKKVSDSKCSVPMLPCTDDQTQSHDNYEIVGQPPSFPFDSTSHSTEISETSITLYSADQNFLQLTPEPSYAGLPKEIVLSSSMVDQFVHVKLLNLLDNAEAPDYMFKSIIEWASQAKMLNYNFCPRLTTRSAVLKDLQKHFNMQKHCPIVKSVQLESINESVPIVSFDFKTQLFSLLHDTSLMTVENLVVNQQYLSAGDHEYPPWFPPYRPVDNQLDEVLSGMWYQKTVQKAQFADPKVFVCPLILYVDKTFIDPMRSRFNLEPFNFTLAIFKRKCRSHFSFWRTLGYVPGSPRSDVHNTADGYKPRNYHAMIDSLLSGMIEIHNNPSILDHFPLRIDNVVYKVNLRIPVAFIISDTQGADKLCGQYLTYREDIRRLHRVCDCPPALAYNTSQKCKWVTMAEMMTVIENRDQQELKDLSQHYIPEHAFKQVDFGENPHGIYGATPNDILHGLKLGIIHYIMEIFAKDDLNPAACHHLDMALKETLPHLKQGGNQHFPRLYFPNGITTLTNMTAEESLGILFLTYLLCLTKQGKNAIKHSAVKMTDQRIEQFLSVFNQLLVFHSWMSDRSEYWTVGDEWAEKNALKSIVKMMDFITKTFSCKSPQGWHISKMHELLHVPKFISLFGAPSNFDSGPCERMHKEIAKQPGRKSQKRHATFTFQAAKHLAEKHVLSLASKELTDKPVKAASAPNATKMGSQFILTCSLQKGSKPATTPLYNVSVKGLGLLKDDFLLDKKLYPNMVHFIVSYFISNDLLLDTIRCCTEIVDDSDIRYRAHHSYRSGSFWYDWAWVSYTNDSEEGYSNVPAKLLTFLPDGYNKTKPSNEDPDCKEPHVVCHPCTWESSKVSSIAKKWNLVKSSAKQNNGIPYDIVPLSAVMGHCLVIPDLVLPDVIYVISEKCEWHEHF